ncbi:hypothetical protein [Nesterenkonia suensis]
MMSPQSGQEPGASHPVDQPSGAAPRVLVDGTVHSIAEPYAEALLIDDGVISWIGAPETAGRLTDGDAERQDLDRALVAPAFVGRIDRRLETLDAGEVVTALDAAAAHGQAAARLVLGVSGNAVADQAHQLRTQLIEVFKAARWHPVVVFPAVRLTGLDRSTAAEDAELSTTQEEALGLLMEVLAHSDDAAGTPIGVELVVEELLRGFPEPLDAGHPPDEQVVEHLAQVSSVVAKASCQLLLDVAGQPAGIVAGLVSAVRQRLREHRSTPRPDRPTVLVDFDSSRREDWQGLVGTAVHVLLRRPGHLGLALAAGVPTSVAPAETVDPWQPVAAHVHQQQAAVSVRAAFNAQTRAAHRSLPAPDGAAPAVTTLAPQLDPGAAASFAVWEVETLAVQTADPRTAAWSTDARARTPLLPYLGTAEEPVARPVLRATVIGGVEVHGTAGIRHSEAGHS